MKTRLWTVIVCALLVALWAQDVPAASDVLKKTNYTGPALRPIDSELKVRVGEQAPDFSLKSTSGDTVTLSQFRDKNNVVISFIPEAWTTISSEQLPAYNAAQDTFRSDDTVILIISAESLPSLYAWTSMMESLWFPVLSDFWPHGAVAKKYGVLRTDGITERATFVVDKRGKIRYIGLQDINMKPSIEEFTRELDRIR